MGKEKGEGAGVGGMVVKGKKVVDSMSGHCATGAGHARCREWWETPSVVGRCKCACHVDKVMVPKGMAKKPVAKKLVAKSR